MSKAIIVVDFAYRPPKRKRALRQVLKYLQYRDRRNNHLAQHHQYERWKDHGLGGNHADILQTCDALKSQHVLAWTWVVSPAPDLMMLVPEHQQRDFISDLTERVVEDYYMQRGFNTPEYAYVIHERETNTEQMNHLHTHVILPGTAPDVGERLSVYNNSSQGHDVLFHDIASRHFAQMLDDTIGMDWRRLRDDPQPSILDEWFPRRA